jgi:hypothetical protein
MTWKRLITSTIAKLSSTFLNDMTNSLTNKHKKTFVRGQ